MTLHKYELPQRYGAVFVKGPDGKEVEHRGGDVVLMDERQARALGATPVQAPAKSAPSASEASTPVLTHDVSTDAAAEKPAKARK